MIVLANSLYRNVGKRLRLAISFVFFSGWISPAFSEIVTASREVRLYENSILVGFDYSSALTILSVEDHILDILSKSSKVQIESGTHIIREQINANTEVSAIFTRQHNSDCRTAFGTIKAGPYYLEFGILLDPKSLKDERPIFAMQGVFNCSEALRRDSSIVYRVTSTEIRRDDSWAELTINLKQRSAELILIGDGI